MAKITVSDKPLAINPLKVGQSAGAALAFLGLARTMPLEHGARGCAAFSKLFFMRHFREPIALQTTAMEVTTVVLGADANVVEALKTIALRNRPELIGLISTSLAETQGADILRTIKAFREIAPEHAAISIVPVSATDTHGSLETGFARALEAIIQTLVPQSHVPGRLPRQVNVLASHMLTPGDIEAIREWVESFGLSAVILPDLGDSLDGHFIPEGYLPLSYGGTRREDIARMGESVATFVIGASLARAADLLKTRTGVPDIRFDGLTGLDACDAFTLKLSEISGQAVPARLERQRSQLLDALVDSQFQIGAARIGVAADGDLLAALLPFLQGAGAEICAAVTAVACPVLERLPVEEVLVGDLFDFERIAAGVELLIGNSHVAAAAARLRVPLIRAGFPQYDFAGGHARQWVGYRGTRQILFDLVNALTGWSESIPPYRARLRQRDSAREKIAL